MSRNSNRPNHDSKEFPVFAGILLGIVMGLAIAGVIAWYVLKKNPVPTPPIKELPQVNKPATTTEKPGLGKPGTAGTAESKAKFEFYKELTGKPEATPKRNDRHDTALVKPVPPAKPDAGSNLYFLQEGAYTNVGDAEKVKAKLALLGMVANVQAANIPDKGVWYRVRLGPYKNTADMNEALATLKLNGLTAAQIKSQ